MRCLLVLFATVSALPVLCRGEPASRPSTQPASRPASRPASGPALSPKRRAQLLEWIRQLGDDAYPVREEATRRLSTAGAEAVPLLVKTYRASKDAEVLERIEQIARKLFSDFVVREQPAGFLGVAPEIVTREDNPKIPPDAAGVRLEEVVEGTPARKAGLRADDVIIRMAGRKIQKDTTIDEFTQDVMALGAGTQVELHLIRNGKLLKVKVKLGRRSDFQSVIEQAEQQRRFDAWWKRTFTEPPESSTKPQ
jgi:predicted metalloprotease with PDZ domain